MKKNQHPISSWIHGLLLCGASIMLSTLASCIDNGYDLSKDIDLTFKLGGDSLSGTVGNTDSIFLSKILKVDDSKMLGTSDKKYYLYKNGSAENISVSVPTISSGPSYGPYYNLSMAGMTVVAGSFSLPIDKDLNDNSTTLSLSGIPSEIKSLRRVDLENTTATITVNITDPSGIVSLSKLNNFTITLPSFIESSDLTSDHKLILNESVSGGSISKQIHITGIDFGQEQSVSNGVISANGNLSINGTLTVSSNNSGTLSDNASFTFSMGFSQSTVSSVAGVFDPGVSVKVDPVTLDDLPDWLQDESVHLDLYNPEIKLDVTNPVNIPFLIKGATVDGYKSVTIPDITIDANKHSLNYITRQGLLDFDPLPISADVIHNIKVSDLNDVIASIPKQIGITIDNVTTDQTQEQSIDLGKTYDMDMHYQVLLPFTFGGEMNIAYSDTIKDLHKNLKDVSASEVNITGTVDTDIPLDMTLSATPYDAQGNDLSNDIAINITKNISGGGGDLSSIDSTDISVSLVEKTSGAVKSKLDVIILKVGASSSETKAGKSLCSNQFLLLRKIKAKVVGGVTVDAN